MNIQHETGLPAGFRNVDDIARFKEHIAAARTFFKQLLDVHDKGSSRSTAARSKSSSAAACFISCSINCIFICRCCGVSWTLSLRSLCALLEISNTLRMLFSTLCGVIWCSSL